MISYDFGDDLDFDLIHHDASTDEGSISPDSDMTVVGDRRNRGGRR
jgi:hypothetical protein